MAPLLEKNMITWHDSAILQTKKSVHRVNKQSYRNIFMQIKSLHQDNHTKTAMAFKSFEKTLEENNSLLSFLNTYTEYFINGILQHCKHIVRLNVHVCVCVWDTVRAPLIQLHDSLWPKSETGLSGGERVRSRQNLDSFAVVRQHV